MSRKFSSGNFNRKEAIKSEKLIVIACEDAKHDPAYFSALIKYDEFANSKVHVQVFHRSSDDEIGLSAPNHLRDSLVSFYDEIQKEYQFRDDDELWIVCDYDRWKLNIEKIVNVNENEFIKFCVSRPDSGLWYFLHFFDISELTLDEMKEMGKSKKFFEDYIKDKHLDGFNKSKPSVERFLPNTWVAIGRAEELDKEPENIIPKNIVTRIYKILESILQLNKGG